MNQILSVEPPKPKKEKKQKNRANNYSGGQVEIEKVVRFFAIVLIVFGTIMIGSGSYSMFQGTKSGGEGQAKPTISVQEISETELKIAVTHNSSLQKVTYNWNGKNPIELDASGKKSIEETIEIPTGSNMLNIYAVDENGKETNYSRTYSRQGDITIELAVEVPNIKVTASGKNQLSYMTYRWDEEEEKRIDINGMETEQFIEIPMGQHTLTVVVVDVNNTTETKVQEVKGVTKPTVTVTPNGVDSFEIKATDEEGIKRIEFILNETNKSAIDLDKVYPDAEQRKEFEYSYPTVDGENKLEVIVYNESGVTETVKVLIRK